MTVKLFQYKTCGLKALNLSVLQICSFFGVFSGKIFFCSEFSSFEGVNLGFWKIFVKIFRSISVFFFLWLPSHYGGAGRADFSGEAEPLPTGKRKQGCSRKLGGPRTQGNPRKLGNPRNSRNPWKQKNSQPVIVI